MKKERRKHRGLLVLLALLVLLLLAAGITAYLQRENLKALRVGTLVAPEVLEAQMEENRQTIQSTVEALPEVTVRPPTEEERQALRSGTLTAPELIVRLTEPETPPQEPQSVTAAEPETPPEPAGEPDAEYERQLSELVARIYVLREEYLAALADLETEAREEYAALPANRRSKSELVKWASGYVARATDLEKQCDSEIDAIAADLEELLRANNGDPELVDQLIYNYANEKSLKKSWYMAQLKERGMLS